MVDTHCTGMGEHVVHHIAVDLVASAIQIDRVQRRLAPILPLLVEHVRRRADGSALGEALRAPPDLGAERMDADRHVGHDTDTHAGVAGIALGAVKLLGGDPFQPAVEVQRVGELLAQRLHFRGFLRIAMNPVGGDVFGGAPLVVA